MVGGKVKTKQDIDASCAHVLGVPQRKVAEITTCFLQELVTGLVKEGDVRLNGLGRLRLVVVSMTDNHAINLTTGTFKKGKPKRKIKVEVPYQLKVYFSKSPTLSKKLKERYGGIKWKKVWKSTE